VVVLGSTQNGRVPIVVGVTRDLTDRVHAGDLVKAIAREAGGGGGGPPQFATGSGTQPAKLGAALQHTFSIVEQALQKD
jgi:alanyl-tRNA synthetase